MKSWKEMMSEAKQEIILLEVADLKTRIDQKEDFVLIDCREAEELQEGHIAESVFIPRGVLEMTVERHFKDRDKSIVIYCAGGGRSALAAQSLKNMGYKTVASMEGGFGAWRQAGFPIEQ
ncbi:MAG: sulfurtransferase [Nitrospirae bacterium]|nr:sulfurtransferase [Candidatus Manganitrophaceae bacterium]